MPPKKAEAGAGAANQATTNGTKSTTRKAATAKATSSKAPAKAKAAPKAKVAAKVAPKKATKASSSAPATKPAASGKRKSEDDDEAEVSQPAKKQKLTEETEKSTKKTAPAKKQKVTEELEAAQTEKPTKKVAAAKKPKAVRAKVILNEAPTDILNVYVFGEGGSGELGLGSAKGQTEVKRPRLNPNLNADKVGVVQVAVGGMHSAVLTHDNKILTWGVNDQCALGRDTKWDGGLVDIDDNTSDSDSDAGSDTGVNPLESTPAEMDMSDVAAGTVFTQLVASDSATFALTDEGLVYGCGTFRGNDGILGFGYNKQNDFILIQKNLMRIPGIKNITKLTCGTNHVLALAKNGAVYAWGSGQQNQLGRRIVERTKLNALVPREFGLPKSITEIGAGSYHSFAVHKNGRVYAWGLNSYGETGIELDVGEDEAVVLKPSIVEGLRGKRVTNISGGAHHTLCTTTEGECLAWGRIDGFQSGIKLSSLPEANVVRDSANNPRILTVPTRVATFNAAYTAAGSDHGIAITTDGKAYSWGFGATYQTGLGSANDVEEAELIDNTAVRDKKLVWAGAGGQFSVLAGLADTPMTNGVH